jgi:hypothetical protein
MDAGGAFAESERTNVMSDSYIQLYRSFTDSEWYHDLNTKSLLIHLLLKANWKAGKWRAIEVKPGELITTLDRLSAETNLSIRKVRTALANLKESGTIGIRTGRSSTTGYHHISICNWAIYQNPKSQNDNETTSKRHRNDIETTTKRQRNDNETTSKRQRNDNETTYIEEGKKGKKEKKGKKGRLEDSVADVVKCFLDELVSGAPVGFVWNTASLVILEEGYRHWMDYRQQQGLSVSLMLARRDAARCCGFKGEKSSIINPPREPLPASVVVGLMENSICSEKVWQDWYYEDAVAAALQTFRGEKTAPRMSRVDEIALRYTSPDY